MHEQARRGTGEGEKESRIDSALSAEPDVGIDPIHNPKIMELSWNQESDTEPTEPLRCPYLHIF